MQIAFFHRNRVRVVLFFACLIFLIAVGFVVWNATKVSTLYFNITPSDSQISVNGSTNYHNGVYSMHPGIYEITISHEGFASKSFTIELTPHYVASIITFLTTDDNSFEFYELKENYESYKKLESIASEVNNITTDKDISAEGFIASFQKAYGLYQNALPINYYTYEKTDGASPKFTTTQDIDIVTSEECQKTLCLKAIMHVADDENFVKKLLTEKGFNLSIFEVIYEKPYSQN